MLFVRFLSGFAGFCVGLVLVGPGIAQTKPGYSRDLPADSPPSNSIPSEEDAEVHPKVVDELATLTEKAAASEAKYRTAVNANLDKPGTISASDLEQLYRAYTDDALTLLRKQVHDLQEAKRARVRPLVSRR
jgi:hypothetical protein